MQYPHLPGSKRTSMNIFLPPLLPAARQQPKLTAAVLMLLQRATPRCLCLLLPKNSTTSCVSAAIPSCRNPSCGHFLSPVRPCKSSNAARSPQSPLHARAFTDTPRNHMPCMENKPARVLGNQVGPEQFFTLCQIDFKFPFFNIDTQNKTPLPMWKAETYFKFPDGLDLETQEIHLLLDFFRYCLLRKRAMQRVVKRHKENIHAVNKRVPILEVFASFHTSSSATVFRNGAPIVQIFR